MVIVESPAAFAKRTGVPERHIRQYAKQGILPHIKTGKRSVLIHIETGLEALKNLAQDTALDRAALMPTPIRIKVPIPPRRAKGEREYKGRPPDSIRLANKK